MGSAFRQMCPRYSGTLTPTAPTAIKLWETFTFTFYHGIASRKICSSFESVKLSDLSNFTVYAGFLCIKELMKKFTC